MSHTLGSLGPSKHWVGQLLLAKFRDGQVYRAMVENVDEGEVIVRYLDYGNSSSWLGQAELAPWDSLLDLVPPQAVQCCFLGAGCREELSSLQQHIAFRDAMLEAGCMRLEVHSSVGELLHVVLRTKEEEDLLKLLCQRPELRDFLDSGGELAGSRSMAPPPLHLLQESPVEKQEATSPVPRCLVSHSVDKVTSWLSQTGEEEQGQEVEARNNEDEWPFKEPDLFCEERDLDLAPLEIQEVDQAEGPELGGSVKCVLVELTAGGPVWLCSLGMETEVQLLTLRESLTSLRSVPGGQVREGGAPPGSCWSVASLW